MPAPATILHANALRTALATAVKTHVETGSGDITVEVYDNDDLKLVEFTGITFGAVAEYGIAMTNDPKLEAQSESFGAGDKTPTYAIIKNENGDESWRTPTITTTPSSFGEEVTVRLDDLTYTAPV